MELYSKSIPRENIIMLLMSGGIIVFNLIGFIVSYFVWKEYSKDSDFIKENGRRLLNFHISFVIYEIIAGILIFVIVGAILMPIVTIAYIVMTVIGMIRYGSHRDYKYSLTFDFIK
ncbi:DUF4870 domain-containing protein [Romboutsia sp.]|uniref:DUF4870 domain-containing protein n=1 Tax=Romboutsia sp. TaxID=1965302 RepID=UPI002CC18713|nr:DUF4870 domain-containing protein [Romboutsia sp.]HSQ90441.1 DUF4870 domain-containing protein [Romboutsia sp.]